MKYTTILHDVRRKFGITYPEYVLADLIFFRANNEAHWCFQGRESMAKELDVEPRTVYRYIESLVNKKLIERHPEDEGKLRPTSLWKNAVIGAMNQHDNNVTPHDKTVTQNHDNNVTPPLTEVSYIKNNIKEHNIKVIAEWSFQNGIRHQNIESIAENFLNHYDSKDWKGFTSWTGIWQNWIKKEINGNHAKAKFPTKDEQRINNAEEATASYLQRQINSG